MSVYILGKNIEMIIKRIIDRVRDEILYFKLDYYTKFVYGRGCSLIKLNDAPKCDFCDLAVVPFNNSKVVDYQIRCLNRYFKFPFRFTVFDNSTNEDIATEIKYICKKHGIVYIKLPKQNFIPRGMGSYSHGIACNYLFENYIRNGGAKYFGLLDHDIFPVEDFDISSYLEKQFFYGVKHRFYIWPGLFFIRMDAVKNKKMDFRPSLHLHGDTGACNGPLLFKNVKWDDYMLVGDEKRCFDGYNDIFEYGYSYFSCGWIHCWNASNYMGKKNIDFKMNMIYEMLEEKLR